MSGLRQSRLQTGGYYNCAAKYTLLTCQLINMTDDIKYMVVFCTCPDEETAQAIAYSLVEHRLAACVNIIPNLISVYSWQGKICQDAELLLIIKTKQEQWPLLRQKIRELHPYQVPEIIALPIAVGEDSYLKWIDDTVD